MLYNDFLQRKEEMEQEYLKEIEGTGLIFNMDENVQDKSRDFLKSLEVHRDVSVCPVCFILTNLESFRSVDEFTNGAELL